MASDPNTGTADEARRADDDKRAKGPRERADPPVGTDGPAADRTKTVAVDDLNSADDE